MNELRATIEHLKMQSGQITHDGRPSRSGSVSNTSTLSREPTTPGKTKTEKRKRRDMNCYVQYIGLCFTFWLAYSHIGLSFENLDTKKYLLSYPYFLMVKAEDSLSPFGLMMIHSKVTHTMLGDIVNSDIGSLLVYRRTGARKTHESVSNGHFTLMSSH